MVGVDVGGNLEDEACKLLLVGVHFALLCHYGSWSGSYLAEAVQQFLYTKVGQCRTEEHRSQHSLLVLLLFESWINTFNHFKVFAQFLGIGIAHPLVQLLALDVHLHLLRHLLLVGLEQVQVLLIYVVHTLESLSLVYGP